MSNKKPAIKPNKPGNPGWLALAILLCPNGAQASCGSASCTLNTQWQNQGVWTKPGWRVDLRHEWIDQDQPRQGTDAVAVGEVESHHDEERTINRNTLLTLDYGSASAWGLSLSLPVIERRHRHQVNPEDDHAHSRHGGETHVVDEAWDFNGLGDLRLLGRYALTKNAGILAGLKLPTGKIDERNAEGEAAERSLQPGSGSTDAMLGMYYHQSSADGTHRGFTQALWQQPVSERDGFKPGRRLTLDVGYRYAVTAQLGLLAQINLHEQSHDRGAQAEPESSGSRSIFFSPGLAWQPLPALQFYGLVQWPLYQRVEGVQLTADYLPTIGVSYRF